MKAAAVDIDSYQTPLVSYYMLAQAYFKSEYNMAEASNPFYAIRLSGEDPSLVFETPDELLTWVARQHNRWLPILNMGVTSFPKSMRASFDAVRNQIRNFLSRAEAYAREQTREVKIQLDAAVDDLFHKTKIPAPSAAFPEFLVDLASTKGDMAAAAALAAIAPSHPNLPFDLSNPEVRVGFVASMLFQLGMQSALAEAHENRLQKISADYEGELGEVTRKRLEFSQRLETLLESSAKGASEQRSIENELFRKQLSDFQEKSDEAVGALKAVEASYVEQMHLQAAVTYWKTKGAGHRSSEKNVRNWLIGYTALAAVALIIFIHLSSSYAADALAVGNYAHSLKYAAIAALVTTIMLWAGRILLRFMISERHLAIDAEERVTMVMTYLALTKEAKLEAADRPLVLSGLFRSGSDGIVKDEGSPDTMMTALLGRVLDRVTK